jgi:hypothetical protein
MMGHGSWVVGAVSAALALAFAAMRACMAGRRGGAAEAPSRSCCRDAEVAAV